MNKYLLFCIFNILLISYVGLGCVKANQNSSAADDSPAKIDSTVSIDVNQEDSSTDLNQLGEDESQYITVRMKGTIGSEQVTMLLLDMEDALDENGENWEYSGKITYSDSGTSYKVKGYNRNRYLFLNAFDANGKNVGSFELVGEFFDDAQGYEGTYRDLESGKESKVKLIEEN